MRFLLIGLAAILVWRLLALALNRTDLFFDEAQYWFWGEELAWGYFSKPPLIGWIIRSVTDVCGETAFCIRLASPVIHTGTALFVGLTAARLYGPTTGLWAGLLFATLPGISLSGGIISTDVPLLFCFAVALYALVWLFDTRSWAAAVLLGIAIGVGLLAKYAMAYFVGCTVLYLLITPERRHWLADPRLGLALIVAAAIIAPNLWWNAANEGVTFAHTADNAKWGGQLFKPGKMLEFFGAQFGVFGPIMFAALLIIVWRWWRGGLSEPDRMLIVLALPVLLVVTTQAFISRAHANWAAVAYVPATVLVTATMVRDAAHWARQGSLFLHTVLMLALGITTAGAGLVSLPGLPDPFARVLGWRSAMSAVDDRLTEAAIRGDPYRAVLADDRAVLAELNYHLRHRQTPIRAWRDGPGFRDHYEMVQGYSGSAGALNTDGPVLFVHHRADDHELLEQLRGTLAGARITERPPVSGERGSGPPRRLYLWRIDFAAETSDPHNAGEGD